MGGLVLKSHVTTVMYWIFVQIFSSAMLLAIDVCVRSKVDVEVGTGSKAEIITLWNNI